MKKQSIVFVVAFAVFAVLVLTKYEQVIQRSKQDLAEARDDLGLALEQLGEAQAKLQERTLINQQDLPDGVYTPISACVVNVEDDKEINVRFTGGNFPPILVVEKE